MDHSHPARRIWSALEGIHAVTYFSPDCQAAMNALGLKGFWMGYFAGRAAPLGAVGPAVVEATFYNFAPVLVRRAVPEIWNRTTPEAALHARSTAAAAVLRDTIGDVDAVAADTVALLSRVVAAGRSDGRVLFAANREVPVPDDPVAALWQCATTLREHRGDGHVAALVAADVSGLECHLLVTAAGSIDAERLRTVRGWTEAEWAAGVDELNEREFVDAAGDLTEAGSSVRARVELLTDELAMQPFADSVADEEFEFLVERLRPIGQRLVQHGLIPVPNPIGVDPT